MNTPLSVWLQKAAGAGEVPARDRFTQWARAAWRGSTPAAVNIRLVGEEESRLLNTKYRHKNRPTNVLSFPLDAPVSEDTNLLGDLVICAPVVKSEARDQGKPADMHWAHMVIHGMLHLQGYDHEQPGDAGRMERLERDIMAGLGYGDPY